MDAVFLQTFLLSLKLASLTTVILFVAAIPLAYILSFSKLPFKTLAQTLISLPLVLPPSVLGFYLLLAFSPSNWFGKMINDIFSVQLAFSFTGILLGSIIFNFPFMVNSIQAGYSNLPPSLREASYTLGKNAFTTLIRVLLPNMKPALLTGVCLTFAHTIGEFGVILMIGGNIPGSTRVASIAVYDEVQSLNFQLAHQYSLFLLIVSFILLFIIYSVNKDYAKWKRY